MRATSAPYAAGFLHHDLTIGPRFPHTSLACGAWNIYDSLMVTRGVPWLLALAAAFAGCDAVRAIPDAKDDVREVEVAIFEGGYGIQWHQKIAGSFNDDRERVRIRLWGDPRTADIIKPRLLRGDPPDLILDERLPIWLLIAADKLIPFDEALAQPAVGSDRPWGEYFAPGMLDMFKSDGHVYAIPAAYGLWGCWYDAKTFEERGWTVPKDWDEFLALCEQIKSEGVAPIAFQGKYPYFYGWNTYVSLVHSVGGLAAINRINNLEEGAFSHPDAVKAAELIKHLAINYFQRGAMAMTHTESQMQFVNQNAAMVFCGIWLENEMKASVPPDLEMRCFSVPTVAGGKGNPNLVHGQGMEFLFVPKDARHPELAFEFARYMVAPDKAAEMGASIGVISPLLNATPKEAVSPALQSCLEIIESSKAIYNVRLRDLLPEWRSQVMNAAIAQLLRGKISAEEYGRLLDEGIEAAKNNPDLIIPPYMAYDPAAYGEPL